jgi:hypothetical protein
MAPPPCPSREAHPARRFQLSDCLVFGFWVNLAYSLFAAMRIGVSRNSHTTIFLMLTLIHSTPNRPLQYRALSSSAAQSASFQYFPAGVFDENSKVSSFRERWYASYLSEMDEPSLYESAKMNESPTFRFLLLWMNRALCVRLTPSPDGTGVLEAKTLVAEYSGSDTRQPEITIRKVPTVVTIDQMRQFQTLLQKADFWSLKTFEKNLAVWTVSNGFSKVPNITSTMLWTAGPPKKAITRKFADI